MTVPEWVMVTLVTCILAILGWAATRLVQSNDETARELGGVKDQLAMINERLGKTELWQLMHGDDDARRFNSIVETHKEMWFAINNRKP